MNHIFPWTLTALSIIGAILNIRKKRSGFAVYTIANIGWIIVNIYHGIYAQAARIIVNIYHGIYAQAALFIVFTGLSIWGWIEWGRKKWGRHDGIP
ncbi:MAG: nicotinamide mononucleotide transporter [Deltaproteobacteria bacterium]|nr:nicotinamide mononucleotide transporter [Deltaproteobacteria bacterium]